MQRHMKDGQLLRGACTDRCRSLLPMGGHLRRGLQACPYFAVQEGMALQLPHMASHCQGVWLRWLWATTYMRPTREERVLMGYFSCLPKGGLEPTAGAGARGAPCGTASGSSMAWARCLKHRALPATNTTVCGMVLAYVAALAM